MNRIRKSVAVGLSGVALVGAVALAPTVAHAKPPVAPACSLVQEPLAVSAAPNTELTGKFSQYGNTSGEWVGADSTYSVPLKDGTTAWLFSDTLLGTVVDNAITPDTRGFINQSIVLERDGELVDTITGGTAAAPDGLFPPDDSNSWYWLGAGKQLPNGELQIGLNKYARFGPGQWDWGWDSAYIGTVNPKTWQVTGKVPVAEGNTVQWTSWFDRFGGKSYIYGVNDMGFFKQGHVARVAGHDLTRINKWEYWTGSGWSTDPSASAPFADNVGNEYSVTQFRDGYILVTQDTSELFSTKVVAYTSCSPTGPFVNKTVLFNMPETGATGSYGDPNIFTYNAHVHPQLSDDGSLVISYNVNTFDNNHVFDDVTIYRPRFWTVTVEN